MKVRFSHKIQETGDVWSYFFTPVDTVEWAAGQSIRLELPRPTFGVSERRFTIASAPEEQHIRITTRVTVSRFKQLLANLVSGAEINAHNVDGDFVWDDSSEHRVFVAGGIGITPFRAMLAGLAAHQKAAHTTLLYGSRERPAVFCDEIDIWRAADPTLTVRYLYNDRITADHILAASQQNTIIYLSGPSLMVEDLHGKLTESGVATSRIKADLFTGNLSGEI